MFLFNSGRLIIYELQCLPPYVFPTKPYNPEHIYLVSSFQLVY